MSDLSYFILIIIMLMNFMLIASNNIHNCIKLVAIQGALNGILSFIFPSEHITLTVIIISIVTIMLKGIFFPLFLFYALKKVSIGKEIKHLIGYKISMLISLFALVLAFWLAHHLFLPTHISFFIVAASFFTTFIGLFLIIGRVKAINQVLGYLVLENGIALFSFAFLIHRPLLVEIGILLDVFVAIFVMGITIFYINKEFDHINTHKLSDLKE
jgi:hydrogenase-4 component E